MVYKHYIQHFNGHILGKPVLAGCPLDSQSQFILILSILMGQAKTLCTHRVLRAVPRQLTSTTKTTSQEVLKQKFYRPDALPVTQPTESKQ